MIPGLVGMKDKIVSGFDSFEVLSISGNLVQSEPIRLPEKEPLVVINIKEDVEPGSERITVTKDFLFYNFLFGQKEVPVGQLKNPSDNADIIGKLLLYLLLFILPSIVFFSFAGIWLKYFLFGLVIGTVAFLMADLTRFSRAWKDCVKAVFYSSVLVILVELVSSVLYPEWMFSLFSFWGLHVYLVPLVAWLVLALVFVACIFFYKKKKD